MALATAVDQEHSTYFAHLLTPRRAAIGSRAFPLFARVVVWTTVVNYRLNDHSGRVRSVRL